MHVQCITLSFSELGIPRLYARTSEIIQNLKKNIIHCCIHYMYMYLSKSKVA